MSVSRNIFDERIQWLLHFPPIFSIYEKIHSNILISAYECEIYLSLKINTYVVRVSITIVNDTVAL